MRDANLIAAAAIIILALPATLFIVNVQIVYSEDSMPQPDLVLYMREVIGLDLSKYNVESLSTGYNLTSSTSNIKIGFGFHDSTFTGYIMWILSGSPIYSSPMPTDFLNTTKMFLQRYYNFTGASYLKDMINMLNQTNQTGPIIKSETIGNISMVTSTDTNHPVIAFHFTANGAVYSNGLGLGFTNGYITSLSDTWNLIPIGGTTVNISKEEATETAYLQASLVKEVWVKNIDPNNYYIGPLNITHIVQDPHYAELETFQRDGSSYPCWHFKFSSDEPKLFIDAVEVGVFADTGQVAYVIPYGEGETIGPITQNPNPSNSPSLTLTPNVTLSPTPTQTLTPNSHSPGPTFSNFLTQQPTLGPSLSAVGYNESGENTLPQFLGVIASAIVTTAISIFLVVHFTKIKK